ncbi:hypothetical protein D3C86_1634460 [compost metagenome]
MITKAIEEETPHARPGKDGFRNKRTTEDRRELKAGKRDHRQEGVTNDMFHQYPTWRQPLGPRGADEILIDDVKRRGPHIAAPDGDIDEG